MNDLGITGAIAGIVLLVPTLVIVLACPFLNKYILVVGLENSIFYGNIGYSISMLAIGWGLCAK